MSNYRGFSLHEYKVRQTTKLQGIELVKMNLLTHIYTLKGERLYMTWFGTMIPELVFEPLTDYVVELIREDLLYVAKSDPRVELLSLTITPNWASNSVVATLRLRFIESATIDDLAITLDFIG